MKPANAIKLEEDLRKVEMGSAAASRITKDAQRKTTEIVERADQYRDDMNKIQKAP